MALLKYLIVSFSITLSVLFANSEYFIKDEFINIEYVNKKTDEIGKELYKKTGISLYLIAIKSTNEIPLVKYEIEFSKQLKSPFILLGLALNEKKVDIIASPSIENSFNKEQILSPYPWRGTIVPILTSKIKGDPTDKYATALFNGYADIADQVASFYDIELQSSVGNANKNTINFFRIIFYTILIFSIAYYIYRRFFKNV